MIKRALSAFIALALVSGPAMAQPRFPQITPEQMTPEQRAVADAIAAGPRKGVRGPFNTWLRSPVLADRLQKVGEYVRFNSSLPPRLSEFAILISARYWTSQYEWFAHYPLAMKGGLDPKIAADLAEGRRPAGMKEDEAAVYDFATELRRDKQVTDETYARAIAAVGERGVVDLIGTTGYYDAVSMTLNVAQVQLPAGEPLPLKPLGR